jgi:tetratricopeptide (TPR) repeat protein
MTKRAFATTLAAVALLFTASCGMVECDSNKRESLAHSNAGVEKNRIQATGDAIKEFNQAITLDPDNHIAAYNLGQIYMTQADGACRQKQQDKCVELWGKAAESFEQATKGSPDEAMYYYRLGQALFESGKMDPARVALEKALSLNNKLFKAHWFLGRVDEAQGKASEAAAAWTQSAKLNPGFGRSFINLGKLYYQWDALPEAIKVLEAGAATAKDSDDRARIYYQLGLCYDAQEQWPKAIAAYEKALADDPGNLDSKLQIGFSLANQALAQKTAANTGDNAKAQKYLDEYIKSAGKDTMPAKLMAASAMKFKLMSAQ